MYKILRRRMAVWLWWSEKMSVCKTVGETVPRTYEERSAAYDALDRSMREGFEYAAETYIEDSVPVSVVKSRGGL